MSDAEGFLARWSRRKRVAARPPMPEPLPAALPPEVAAEAAPVPEFDPASLPPVESLTPDSDLAAFLRAEVPAALRQAALRRMWSLDPAIRDYIGPADYAWDFNLPDGMPGFSPELAGDVKQLLAQAIGLGEPEPAPPPEPDPVPAGDIPPSLPAKPPLPLAEAPCDEQPSEPPQEAPLRPRRHGGAVPS